MIQESGLSLDGAWKNALLKAALCSNGSEQSNRGSVKRPCTLHFQIARKEQETIPACIVILRTSYFSSVSIRVSASAW